MAQNDTAPPSKTREQILAAAVEVLQVRGAGSLNVRAVMQQAALSRTEFYRQFRDIYDVVEALIERIASHIEQQAGPWIREHDAIGNPDVVHDNLVRSARNIQPWATLLAALYDAAGLDPRLRTIWHHQLVQPRTEATATAIRRDQKAGAIRDDLDPEATATALYAMSEHLLLDLVCRQGADPDDYARIAAPIWQTVLFTPSPPEAGT